MAPQADPLRAEAFTLFSQGQRIYEVASALGKPRSTIQSWYETWKQSGPETPQRYAPPNGQSQVTDLELEKRDMEIAALRAKLKIAEGTRPEVVPAYSTPPSQSPEARWKAAEADNAEHIRKALLAAKFSVDLPDDKPSALVFISDQHIALGNCIDLKQMRLDAEAVASTEGAYAVLGGDGCDNHVKHRAAVLAARSQPKEQFELFEYYLQIFSHRVLVAISGNHCVDTETEALTKRGWKTLFELLPDDKVLGLDSCGVGKWQPIERVFTKQFTGNLKHLRTTRLDIACTPEHRIMYKTWHGGHASDSWGFMPASEAASGSVVVPTSSRSENPVREDISDEELEIVGWLLTDGWINSSKKSRTRSVAFSQRQSNAHQITSLLDRAGLPYKTRTRTRAVAAVCGKAIKSSEPEVTIYLGVSASRRILELCPVKGRLPSWAWEISDWQFSKLLYAIIHGDGTFVGKSAYVLYGKRDFLDSVQAAAIFHGWNANITIVRPNDHRLNLCYGRPHRIDFKGKWSDIPYSGIVWCLTVPLGNFLIRRHGRSHFTGNCLWTDQVAGVDVMGDLVRRNRVCYAPDEAFLDISLGSQKYKVAVRHQYRMNSSFNETHCVKQYYRNGTENWDIGCIGHHHVGACEYFYGHGEEKVALRPGSYQITSAYSRQYGFNTTVPTCPTVVVYPDRKEMVAFHRLEPALRFLKAERG